MEKKLSAWCKNAKIEMINRDLKTTTLARAYDPNRGAKWFERMKVAEKAEILEGARKIGG